MEGTKIPPETHIQDMTRMLNSPILSDVTIKIGDKQIFAHKNILSFRCEYFHKLFNSNMKESIKGEISIEEFSYDAVYALLLYLYTGQIKVVPQLAFEVMKLSQSYLLDRLRVLCELEVTAALEVENAADLLMEAERYSCRELKVMKVWSFVV
jgi:speckle-type POZ protein